jgi:hypothetical protein
MTSARTTRWETRQVEHSQDNSSGSYARTCRALTVGYDPSDITDLSSITSSATASNSGGILRPSALAVFRLIASSNLIGGSSTRGMFMMMRHLITFLDRRGRSRPQTKSDIPCNGVSTCRIVVDHTALHRRQHRRQAARGEHVRRLGSRRGAKAAL